MFDCFNVLTICAFTVTERSKPWESGQEICQDIVTTDPAPEPGAGSMKVKTMAALTGPADHDMFGEESDTGDALEDALDVNPEAFIKMSTEEASHTKLAAALTLKQPGFFLRDAFVALSESGLAVIPSMEGVHIWHAAGQQWHAQYPGKSYSPKWGIIRSEKKALGLAIAKLWAWFVADYPNDKEAKTHLAFLQSQIIQFE